MKKTLPPQVVAELPQRLCYAADRYYYAAILTSAPFDAANMHAQRPMSVSQAAQFALSGPNKCNDLITPPMALFGLCIELYLKLFLTMEGGGRVIGHNILDLFLQLEVHSPIKAEQIIRWHRYARGTRSEFVEDLESNCNVFEEWRYSFEHELLVGSPDTLLAIADALRDASLDAYPDLKRAV
jgi:hypothetical protein